MSQIQTKNSKIKRKPPREVRLFCKTCSDYTKSVEPINIKHNTDGHFYINAVCEVCNSTKAYKKMNQEQIKLLPLEVKESPKGTVFNNTFITKDGGGSLPLLAMLPAITAGISRASEISRNKATLSSEISALAQAKPSIANKALANYSGEALPMAALAPLIIGLLPSVIEAAPSVIGGIKKIISGEGYSQADMELLASETAQPGIGHPCSSLVQPKTGGALPIAALAPLIIGLLPSVIEAAPSVIGGIERL